MLFTHQHPTHFNNIVKLFLCGNWELLLSFVVLPSSGLFPNPNVMGFLPWSCLISFKKQWRNHLQSTLGLLPIRQSCFFCKMAAQCCNYMEGAICEETFTYMLHFMQNVRCCLHLNSNFVLLYIILMLLRVNAKKQYPISIRERKSLRALSRSLSSKLLKIF